MEELGPLFVNQTQSHYLWIVALLAAAGAAITAVLGLVRGQVGREIGLAGLILLPTFSFLIANVVVIDRSREV